MSKEKRLQIRNSTAEFLIFTRQAGEDGIEVRVEDETVWLTQKLMAGLFEVTVPTINEQRACEGVEPDCLSQWRQRVL